MSKKAALDNACEYISNIFQNRDCAGECILYYDCEETTFDCSEFLKKYFKQQADIPDGWDVVKEIYEQVCSGEELSLNGNFGHHKEKILGSLVAYHNIKEFTKQKLQQAGIEVEDE